MALLRTILLVRHGETEGRSSVRFHGRTDVPLSDAGREQMRRAARRLPMARYDLLVASPLRRAWESARILAPDMPVRLEDGLREIDFGRWEGLTADEIRARDPILFEDWQARRQGFELPSGERRADFRKRVVEAGERLLASGARTAIVVCHKGVIRTLTEHLTGAPLDGDIPLGGSIQLSCGAGDAWSRGRRSSNPPGLGS